MTLVPTDPSKWILSKGVWDDTGYWQDAARWRDGAVGWVRVVPDAPNVWTKVYPNPPYGDAGPQS